MLAPSNLGAQEKGSAGSQDDVAALRATVENLRLEVELLRKALLRIELERRRETIQQIKAQLETLRTEHARLMELDRVRQQDLRDIEELLTRGELRPAERIDIDSARSVFAITQEREIVEQSAAVRVREGELLRRLETEEQYAKRLEEAWKLTRGNHNDTIEDFVRKALPGRANH
jgi:hypothetical protein